jgi:glycosyltransferase involved in cell wall biosynthesis
VLYLDATVLFEERKVKGGIYRVELELIRALVRHPDVIFVNLLGRVGPEIVDSALVERRVQLNWQDVDKPMSVKRIRSRLAQFLAQLPIAIRLFVTIPIGGLIGAGRFIVGTFRLARACSSELAKFVSAENEYLRQFKGGFNAIWHRKMESKFGCLTQLDEADTFFSAGLLFKRFDLVSLGQQREKTKFKLVIMVHDIVPILFPHLSYQADLSKYHSYFSDLIQLSDLILTISLTTKQDLESYSVDRLFLTPPNIRVVKLGEDHLIRTNGEKRAIPDFVGKRFILYVSTFNPRKNHDTLYRAYELAADEGFLEQMPILIMVGSSGWGSDEVQQKFRMNPKLVDSNQERKTVCLGEVTDEELRWLYSNCLFTLYPSLYEGWGMPITESLLYGKRVVVSDSISLYEAGGPDSIRVQKIDAKSWLSTILELASLAEEFQPQQITEHTWEESASAILSAINEGR